MFRLGNLGFFSLFGSIIIVLLQTITYLLNKDLTWKKLRFADIIDPRYYNWLDNITLFNFNSIANYVLNMHLFVLLFCLTIVFFILSGIFEKGYGV
jgi:hypothetical protein